MSYESVREICDRLTANISTVLFGAEDRIRLVLTAMVAGGHILLDDIPGTGKTTLAKALARSTELEFRRVQFTPDLLPSDVTGINYFNMKTSEFVLRRGPAFTNILLADEINRTTPRTQSALLECMQERQVTIDGETMPLPEPFFVIATQNPIENQGTFPLPEAQLDRFMMKISLGYPDRDAEMTVLDAYTGGDPMESLRPVCTGKDLLKARRALNGVRMSEQVKSYAVDLAAASRKSDRIRLGASPRCTLDLMRAARAYAAAEGRDHVLPDDVKAVAVPVISHRIIPRNRNTLRIADSSAEIVQHLLDTVPVPLE